MSTLKKARKKAPVVLYSYWRSSCSWRVRIALEYKKIDYDYKAVHLVKDGGEQFQEEMNQLSANQVIVGYLDIIYYKLLL